jgi:hypothetical protein
VIIKEPLCTMDFTGSSPVDMTDHIIMAQLNSPQEAVDDRTFGAPYATDHTVGAESVVLRCKWSSALMAQLSAYVDDDIDFSISPSGTAGVGGETITGTVKYSKLPLAEFSVGSKAECDLVLAVVDKLTWAAGS